MVLSFYFWVDAFILRVYFVESALFHICVFDWGKQKMLLLAFLANSGLQWTLHFAHPKDIEAELFSMFFSRLFISTRTAI